MTNQTTTASPLSIDGRALLFTEAHTANTFTDEPVGAEQVRAIHDLVKWAPTSYNQAPMRGVVVASPEARARLVPLMIEGNRAKTAAAPLTVVLGADDEFTRDLPRLFPVQPDLGGVLFADPAARVQSARLNASLQVAYFILGVRALGLAVGPMSGFDAEGVDREFFPPYVHSLVVANLGHAAEDGHYPRMPRLGFDDVFRVA